MAYQIFIVEDHPRMRATYCRMIQFQPDMDLHGEAASGEEALEKLGNSSPDLILVDVSLPGISGIELLRKLEELRPEMSALIVSGHDKELYMKEARFSNVKGYVMKHEGPEVLLETIRKVLAGNNSVEKA
jgi:DNA-binding NarL/FixJ family response regulator